LVNTPLGIPYKPVMFLSTRFYDSKLIIASPSH
jgi:hypothetical protein